MRDYEDFAYNDYPSDYMLVQDHEDAMDLLKAQMKEEFGILMNAIRVSDSETIAGAISQIKDYLEVA